MKNATVNWYNAQKCLNSQNRNNKEETTMASISIDNGNTFMDAKDAMAEINERNLWDNVVMMMDDDIREKVHAELAPCTDEEFLARYLE